MESVTGKRCEINFLEIKTKIELHDLEFLLKTNKTNTSHPTQYTLNVSSCFLCGFPTTLLSNMLQISYIVTECNVSITTCILHKAQFTSNDSELERKRDFFLKSNNMDVRVSRRYTELEPRPSPRSRSRPSDHLVNMPEPPI